MSSLLRGHGWNTTSNSIWQREQRWGGGFTVPYSISVIFNSCHHKSQRTAHWINPATYLQGRDILCLFKGGGRPDKGHLIQKPSSNLCATNGKNQSMRSSGEWFVGHQSKDSARFKSCLTKDLSTWALVHLSYAQKHKQRPEKQQACSIILTDNRLLFVYLESYSAEYNSHDHSMCWSLPWLIDQSPPSSPE